MKNKNLILTILGILLFGLCVINNDLNDTSFPTEPNCDKSRTDLKSSGFWNLTGSPILIDDTDPSKDWAYTASNYAWCSGSGTSGNPYVVENVTIDGQGVGSCIEIRNSTAFFIVKNCTVYNSGLINYEDGGIELNNTKNGQISENDCSNNQKHGILLTTSCSNVNITNNTFLNMEFGGIHLLGGCYNNIISHNYGESSIMLWGSYNNVISDNDLFGVGSQITLYDYSSHNLISKNEIYGEGSRGILLNSNSNYNVVKNNTVKDSTTTGLEICDCRDNIIRENRIKNLGRDSIGFSLHEGFALFNANNTLVSNNIVSNTKQVGIKAFGNNNTIEGNEIYDHKWYGIWAEGDDNTYSKNSIVNTYMGIYTGGQNLVINDNFISLNELDGIYLGGTCNIFGNTITSNGQVEGTAGIRLGHCNNSLIWNNTLAGNYGGISLELLCFENAVYENNITGIGKNDNYGIKAFQSNNNNITKNLLTGHCVALYLKQSNYSNVVENVMRQNLKCIEEIDCIENFYRDNSCDLDDIAIIPGFDVYFLIGIIFIFTVVSAIRKFNRKN